MKIENRYLKLLLKIIDLNDPYKSGHSRQVANLAELMGHNLDLGEKALSQLEEAALLHDVGKVMLPGDLWIIPQEIEEEEKEMVKKHPVVGARLLKESGFKSSVVEAVLHHHEWWDGTGYPEQLQGDEIPLLAAIVGVAEAYVSMITYDIYSEDMEKKDAVEQIESQAGIQFAPRVVDVFHTVI